MLFVIFNHIFFFIFLRGRKTNQKETNLELGIRNLELGAMQALLLNFEV